MEKHDCGSSPVLHGGSWNNNENNLQSDNPNTNAPRNENNNIGFRISSPGIRKDPLSGQTRQGTESPRKTYRAVVSMNTVDYVNLPGATGLPANDGRSSFQFDAASTELLKREQE